eukprot:scaffold1405_cov93-Isochrysis_galbana.AAC.1
MRVSCETGEPARRLAAWSAVAASDEPPPSPPCAGMRLCSRQCTAPADGTRSAYSCRARMTRLEPSVGISSARSESGVTWKKGGQSRTADGCGPSGRLRAGPGGAPRVPSPTAHLHGAERLVGLSRQQPEVQVIEEGDRLEEGGQLVEAVLPLPQNAQE